MKKEIIYFNKRPSSIGTIAIALKQRNVRFSKDKFKPFTTKMLGAKVDMSQLGDFWNVCHVSPSDTLSLVYPLTLVYPFNIRIISTKNIPLVMFKMLNIHSSIISYRKIYLDDELDIECSTDGYRILPGGVEIDIKSIVTANGIPAWQAVNTFYFRGRFKDPAENPRNYFHERISEPDNIFTWKLPDKNGLKFAKISGDSNPLHFNRLYSKMMGFKRDFAQPFLICEKVMELMRKKTEDKPVKLDMFYKGPVYYGKMQTIKTKASSMSTSFEVFCEGNERPSIHGIIADLP